MQKHANISVEKINRAIGKTIWNHVICTDMVQIISYGPELVKKTGGGNEGSFLFVFIFSKVHNSGGEPGTSETGTTQLDFVVVWDQTRTTLRVELSFD